MPQQPIMDRRGLCFSSSFLLIVYSLPARGVCSVPVPNIRIGRSCCCQRRPPPSPTPIGPGPLLSRFLWRSRIAFAFFLSFPSPVEKATPWSFGPSSSNEGPSAPRAHLASAAWEAMMARSKLRDRAPGHEAHLPSFIKPKCEVVLRRSWRRSGGLGMPCGSRPRAITKVHCMRIPVWSSPFGMGLLI